MDISSIPWANTVKVAHEPMIAEAEFELNCTLGFFGSGGLSCQLKCSLVRLDGCPGHCFLIYPGLRVECVESVMEFRSVASAGVGTVSPRAHGLWCP
jgi:hypothetical protein